MQDIYFKPFNSSLLICVVLSLFREYDFVFASYNLWLIVRVLKHLFDNCILILRRIISHPLLFFLLLLFFGLLGLCCSSSNPNHIPPATQPLLPAINQHLLCYHHQSAIDNSLGWIDTFNQLTLPIAPIPLPLPFPSCPASNIHFLRLQLNRLD